MAETMSASRRASLASLRDKIDFSGLQRLSMALMLPLAILPAAGICLALGVSFDIPILEAVGAIVFGNLPLLFALGIAIGLTGEGTVALSVVTGYLMLNTAMGVHLGVTDDMVADGTGRYAQILGTDTLQTGVLGGLVVGMLSVFIYRRFHKVELPSFLAFFNGKRLVPILVTAACLALGYVFPFIWMPIQDGLQSLSVAATRGNNGVVASFIYAVGERSLIPTGLHHIWNVPFYYNFGEYTALDGTRVTGDIPVFFAQLRDGAPLTAGLFTTGRFPIMMFGLPALALAIYQEAPPERRPIIKGLLLSGALTTFITGITEPLEYSFLFAAPLLFIVHIFVYASSFVVMNLLEVHIGHPFAAGLIDFTVNGVIPNRTAWWLVPIVGAGYAALYYFGGRFLIRKFNLKTPGREDTVVKVSADATGTDRSRYVLAALGGTSNVVTVDACASRLRCGVRDNAHVDEPRLKELGAYGLVRLGKDGVQVIFGGKSQNIRDEIQALIANGDTELPDNAPPAEVLAALDDDDVADSADVLAPTLPIVAPANGTIVGLDQVPDPVFAGEVMGPGAAIVPADGTFVSPVDGTVFLVMKSGHAYGIRTVEGLELLLHIGIDTVKLDGRGFDIHVTQGANVRAGDPLCTVDVDVVEQAGYSMVTPLVLTKGAVGRVVANSGEATAGVTEIIAFDLQPIRAV
jgi:glucose-specific phosphotransferase system IIA component